MLGEKLEKYFLLVPVGLKAEFLLMLVSPPAFWRLITTAAISMMPTLNRKVLCPQAMYIGERRALSDTVKKNI